MNKVKYLWVTAFFFVTIIGKVIAGEPYIIDTSHYSIAFGEIRNYRIFLPPDYYKNKGKRYPVIYFFHGWSQRYFGPVGDDYSNYDTGDDNNGDNIANYVASHDVIVVKPDGFNPVSDNVYNLTPYNECWVTTHRQFPIYFPELVNHIDASFNTIPDRTGRAACGLSMGGFMSYWVAGKYPDMVSAAGNFCGSPEFMAGPLKMPVDYRILDMYRNYRGVNVRFHYGNKDNLRNFHLDMNRIWREVMENYEFKVYDAYHSTCGLGEMFDFCLGTFSNPPARPRKWHHIDLYPEFSVWDYHVSTDRFLPGFTILEDVDRRGFRCAVREFLPDGELMSFVNVSVQTPPVYEKNQEYIINDIQPLISIFSSKTIRSDNEGRLKIIINGGLHNIGINKSGDNPNLGIASVRVKNMNWAINQKEVEVSIDLFNKGSERAENVKAFISPVRNYVKITESESDFGNIEANKTATCRKTFSFIVNKDSVEIAGFNITITDGNRGEWKEFFEIPMKTDLPEFKEYEIADGRSLSVAKAGVLSENVILGQGNGDGIANPGESIVIVVKDNGKYWRTSLFSADKFVNPCGVNARVNDFWDQFGGIGSSPKYSVPVISSDCPEGHNIQFFASFWVPENKLHVIRQGTVKIKVQGKDTSPPVIDWIYIKGDNTILVKVYDGSGIDNVKATLIPVNDVKGLEDVNLKDPGVNIEVTLDDANHESMKKPSAGVFSNKLVTGATWFYRVKIEVEDIFGNSSVKTGSEVFLVYDNK